MLKLLIPFIAIFLFISFNSNSQTVGDVIGEGRKFDSYGKAQSGYYKIMIETKLLNAVIVEEAGSIYHFNIRSSNKRSENSASISYDIEVDQLGDLYYLSLTISKTQKDCLLNVFDGTKREWNANKIPVRSYGYYNF